jgi:anti-sigma factor RsiW
MKSCGRDDVNVLQYLGGELKGSELEEFREHLVVCEDCKVQLQEEQVLSQMFLRSRPLYLASATLRDRIAAVLDQDPSAVIRPQESLYERLLRFLKKPPHNPVWNWKLGVAALVVTTFYLVFVPDFVERVRAADYVQTAAATHRGYLNGTLAPEVQSDSPEVVTAWFAGRVPFHFQLPTSQLAADSKPAYRLTGARLVNYKGSRAALVTYQIQKQSISLLVASSASAVVAGGDQIRSGTLTFHYHRDSGLNVITWSNHGLSYALVSSVSGSARQSCLVCHENMADHDAFRPSR